MPSVYEILLAVQGESASAQTHLAAVAREVAAFDHLEATADLKVDVDEARARVREMFAELEKLDSADLSPELRIRTEFAVAQLRELSRRLGDLSRQAENENLFDISRGFARQRAAVIAQMQGMVRELGGIQRQAEQETNASEQRQLAIHKARVAAQIELDRSEAQIRETLSRAARRRAEEEARFAKVAVPVDVEGVDAAEAKVAELVERLNAMAHDRDLRPELRLQVSRSLLELALVQRRIKEVRDTAEHRGGMVEAAALSGLFTATQGAVRGAEAAAKAVQTLVDAAQQGTTVFEQLKNVSGVVFGEQGIGKFAGFTRDLQESTQAIVMIMVGGLIPTLIALVGSLGAAITAAGGLATAFLASLGPAVGLLIGLFQRFQAILQARQALQQEADKQSNVSAQETNRAAAADRAAAAAAEARHNALNALRSAQQQQASAERALAEARRQAQDAIDQAVERERRAAEGIIEAQRDIKRAVADVARARQQAADRIASLEAAAARNARSLADAQQRVRDATVEAGRAMRDAYQSARDAALSLEDAILGIADAQLSLEEAQLRVNELLKQTPALANDVFTVLQKLQNVDLGPDAFAGVSQQIMQVGGGNPTRDALALRRALLELARAKLGVRQATERQNRAENDLADSNAEANRFAREGINAYKPLRDAMDAVTQAAQTLTKSNRELGQARRDGVKGSPEVQSALEREHDARRRLVDAQRDEQRASAELARLRKDGVDGAASVLNALDAERNARQRVAEAQHDVARAGKDAADQIATIPASVLAADQAFAKLSTTEQGFLSIINQAIPAIQAMIQPATDLIFHGLGGAIQQVLPLTAKLAPMFTNLAGVWARSIQQGASSIMGPAWQRALEVIFRGSAQIAEPAMRALGAILEIFRNIAVAFMPALVRLFHDAANGLQALAGRTGDIDGLRSAIAPLVDAFRVWMDLIGAVGGLLLAFFRAAAPAGNGVVKFLADGARALTTWLTSGPGLRVLEDFFRATIPLGREIATTIVELIPTFLRLLQIGSPFFELFFRGFNDVLKIVNAVLGVVASLGPFLIPLLAIWQPWLAVLLLIPPILDVIEFSLSGWVMIFGLIADGISLLRRAIGAAFDWLIWPFKKALEFIKKLFGIASPARVFRDIGRSIVDGLRLGLATVARVITAPFRAALNLVLSLFRTGVTRLRSVAGAIRDGIVAAVRVLPNLLSQIARRARELFLSGLRVAGNVIGAIFDPIFGFLKRAINGLIGAVNWVIRQINRIPNVNTPFGSIGIPDIPEIPKLAAGGLATRRTLAELGEGVDQEAVLPLNAIVMGKLADAITSQMQLSTSRLAARGLAPAGAGAAAGAAGGGGEHHEHYHLTTVGGGNPDARIAAMDLAKEMRRRRGGRP